MGAAVVVVGAAVVVVTMKVVVVVSSGFGVIRGALTPNGLGSMRKTASSDTLRFEPQNDVT